jgi:hypothetical protein
VHLPAHSLHVLIELAQLQRALSERIIRARAALIPDLHLQP